MGTGCDHFPPAVFLLKLTSSPVASVWPKGAIEANDSVVIFTYRCQVYLILCYEKICEVLKYYNIH